MSRTLPVQVLVVDDDHALVAMIATLLQREGMQSLLASTGQQGIQLAQARPVDLVLLDLMLPDMSGFDVCRQLRATRPRLPILMLTARGDPVDRVLGLELGADDYLSKPFDARELVARIRAVWRRVSLTPAQGASRLRWGAGACSAVLDLDRWTLQVDGRDVVLSTIEFKLLGALVRHAGQALSREALSRAIQAGGYAPLDRAVDVQIGRLRKKLRDVAPGTDWILTVRGEGYAFTAPVGTADNLP